MADRHQRRALPRFHLRRGGQRARPRPSAPGRGDHRAGQEGLARFQSLPHPRGRAAGRSGCARRASRTWCSSPIPAPRRWNARSRWRASTSRRTASRSATASSRSRAPFTGARSPRSAAGGQKKYLEGFGPVVEGFDQVPFADLEATKRAIGPETAAILIEPIMGEGGVRVVPPEFLRALRRLCDEHGLLLVFDEVQTGVGRTGQLFAYQQSGVSPDIMALAKALGRRLPARRLPRHRRSRQGHGRRHPRLDLRRQSAGDGGGRRAARRGAGRRLPRARAPHRPRSSSRSSRRSGTAIPP